MIWFKFYSIWGDGVAELSDAEAGRFIKAVCCYAETGEIQSLSGNERILFAMTLKQLKQDKDRSTKISSARAEAGRSGGLSSKQTEAKQANESNCLQNEAKQSNCSIKNKELRMQNTEEELNNICAETRASSQEKPKLTPDDPDYWKFAKENADLAETFYKSTGICPVKSQYGRWVNDLRDIAEAGISAEQLRKTIAYMQSENIPVAAPGSCLKTAQWLKSRGSVPVKSQPKSESWIEAAERVAMSDPFFPADHIEVLP